MTDGDRKVLPRPIGWRLAAAAILLATAHGPASAQTASPAPAPTAPRSAVAAARSGTIEASDLDLARSLAILYAEPTADHQRSVAAQYLRLHVLDAAYEHYAAAVQLAPSDGLAHAGLSVVWRTWGFDDRALGEAYRAVYFAPDAGSSHNALGVALAALGFVDAARTAFNESRRLDPAAAYPLANLCGLELGADRTDAAIDLCTQAVGLADARPATHGLMGIAYARVGQFTQAHEEFLLAGTRASAAYELGMAYLRAGRKDDAARAFRAAMVAEPTSAKAARELRLLMKRARATG